MPLSEVRHQERALQQVMRALASARVPHAYILYGPDGVGKELFARRLAALLLCEQPQTTDGAARDACLRCQSCHLVEVDSHPDLHIVHRLLNAYHPDSRIRNAKAMDLGVDVVRRFLIEPAGLSPAMGRAKVFIVREADAMNFAAQNALLKTLEEPPPATFLLLLATSLDALLQTTRSRCQVVPFGPLPAEFIRERLAAQRPDVAVDELGFYAALAQGSVAKAVRYAEDELAVFGRELAGHLEQLTPDSTGAVVKVVSEFAKEAAARHRKRDEELSDTAAQRAALRDVFNLMATWYRDRLYVAVGLPAPTRGSAITESDSGKASAAAEAVRLISEMEARLEQNVNVQLVIESLMFRLAVVRELPAAALI